MKFLSTTALSLGFLAMAGCAQAQQSTTDLSKSQIEEIVKEYLLENPEVIRDALIELQIRDERGSIEDTKTALVTLADSLYKDPRDMTVGPDNAKVTIIEFFDYNCGFCKRSTQWLKTIIEEHPNDVRVIFKELPVLEQRTKTSRSAARAALAAGRQGKYADMHFALMEGRGLTPERVRDMAKKSGLDMKQFDKDMLDAALDRHIDDTLALAQKIPALTGTPFFVIGDEFISGANTEQLKDVLNAALKG